MISIESISKSYGPQILFEEAGFKLNRRERVGVVGRNGHGKTTLFRLITGQESPDDGAVVIPKNYRIGYVRQHLAFTESTVLAEGMKGLHPEEADHHWKVEKVLSGLGFSPEDMERPPSEFSGGYQVRLNLTKVLVSEPDLLLLDEPTNYLDITAIRWIEQFLNQWPRELLLITHDRGFMDRVVTHTVAVHRRKMRKIEGDTGKLYDQIAQDEEIYEKTRINDERKKKEIEQFITRFRAKARLANLVQSRIKTLEKMEKRDKLEQIRDLEFSFRSRPFRGKHMMTADSLSFSYPGGETLFRNLTFSVVPGERICIVGPNGRGKTTLLKVLGGVLKQDAGQIAFNPGVEKGYFEQTNVETLEDTRTVAEEILYCDEGVDLQTARNIAGAMMFEGDSALKKIGVLSGGEKSRVMLGKLLATPANLLLLDEPTNHLDMAACDALLAAIDQFEGAVIMVTHSEMFLHALADRLIVFQNGGAEVFEGGYGRFLEKGGWADTDLPKKKQAAPVKTGETEIEAPSPVRLNKKELRRRRSEIISEKSRCLKPLEKRISALENIIDAEEGKLTQLNADMQEAADQQETERIVTISKKIHASQKIIDDGFEELEALSDTLEKEGAVFEKRLAEIDRMTESAR